VNIGIIVAAIFSVAQISLTILLMVLRRNKKPLLEKIIKQDCLLFDRSRMSVDDYFYNPKAYKRTQIQPIDLNQQTRQDMNTSRHLNMPTNNNGVGNNNNNQPSNSPNKLQLKDNGDGLDNFDAIDKTVDQPYDAQTNYNNVKIFNNFVGDGVTTIANTNHVNRVYNPNVTMKDYESLTMFERIKYDKRTFGRYLWDTMMRRNIIISVILKHSISDPIYIRVAKAVLSFSLIFGLNAYLYDDYYIDTRAMSTNVIIYINLVLYYSYLHRRSSENIPLSSSSFINLHVCILDRLYPRNDPTRVEQRFND
jgi:hypothetical protein